MSPRIAVIVPVFQNAATLADLATRLGAVLDEPWVLRLVVDACPDGSTAVADGLATADPRIHVTDLTANVGQHRAIAAGLQAEPDAHVWVCMDADLQDPPEAVPYLVDTLLWCRAAVVFAGRRGAYESPVRRLTGGAHRRVLAGLTGLPHDAGAFLAMDARARDAVITGVLAGGAPSVVVAAAGVRGPILSRPVLRAARSHGRTAWSTRARIRQSARTIRWAVRHRLPYRMASPPEDTRRVGSARRS